MVNRRDGGSLFLFQIIKLLFFKGSFLLPIIAGKYYTHTNSVGVIEAKQGWLKKIRGGDGNLCPF
jgi:hypothetical protein